MTISLVTGGAGFIGSHIVEQLISLGHEVVVVDNEYSDNENFYWRKDTYNVNIDITDKALKNAFTNVDYVFHLAAEARIGPAIENPVNAVNINTIGTCNVLQCARDAGVKKVMYSSTSSGYGLNTSPNIETQPDDCLNPYSASKVAAEKFCKMYSDLYGLETVVLRYFNVFGERSPTRGQYAPVIGIFDRQKNNDEPLTIVGDGTQRRDFIYVGDVAKANLIAAEASLDKKYFGQVFNIGSGINYSVQQIADAISDNQTYIPKREGEMETTWSNIDKALEILNWKPEVDVLEWIKK